MGFGLGAPSRVACVVLVSWCLGGLPGNTTATEAPVKPGATGRRQPANRLAHETSPYLLLHAQNPVDWFPWGPEALEKARTEGKLIFLSIGYSSCHWCHVMEHRVFSNPEIAKLMNEHFVNIKVDREERPDIDDVYMTALTVYQQAIGSRQGGGWPLSMFLTPDARPLAGGTYYPPADEGGRMGFPTLIKNVVDAWRDRRKDMESNADLLTRAVKLSMSTRAPTEPSMPDRELVTSLAKNFAASFDAEQGGFGFNPAAPDRPKFPVPAKLALLQYEAKRSGDEQAAKMLYFTLDRMALGGIHDHLGGGFHRYSTDRFWRVPHFEKMLYDNAQLADAYADAFRQTNNAWYRTVAEGAIDFVLRDLTDAGGAFYAALDADSEGDEGKCYLWTRAELAAVLPGDALRLFETVYGLAGPPDIDGAYVLKLSRSLPDLAVELKLQPSQLERRLTEMRGKLLAARRKRPQPMRDNKVLTSWNGLMIRALAHAGAIFERPDYLQAAEKAADFVLSEMRDSQGRLLHSWCANQARLNAYLDDYAFLVEGLLALHLATREEKWVNAARRLNDAQMELFWDDAQKGCFFTAHDHEPLLARTKSPYDAVLPSGNSVAVRNLLRLASLSRQPAYRDRAREILELFTPLMESSPGGMTNMALALGEYLDDPNFAVGHAQATAAEESPEKPSIVLAAGGETSKKNDPAKKKKDEPVAAELFLNVDRLPPGGTCKILVVLNIAAPWHVNANPAQPDYMVPTQVSLKSKSGVTLAEIKYPAGEKLEMVGAEMPLLVYTKQARLFGVLEVPEEAAGAAEELTVAVKYQACNDEKCLAPKTLNLPLEVKVAQRGEAVKPANEKLFAKPRKKAEGGNTP